MPARLNLNLQNSCALRVSITPSGKFDDVVGSNVAVEEITAHGGVVGWVLEHQFVNVDIFDESALAEAFECPFSEDLDAISH